MKAAPWFIGGESGAAGYRLAGLEVHACRPEEAPRALDSLLGEGSASLVLLAPTHAARIGEERLAGLIRACDPPVTVVRDATGGEAPFDLARRVKSMLGVAT